MNKTSRKILSSLIASTMLASMLPGITVFADTEAEEGTEGTELDAAYSITINENSFESPDLRAYVSKNFDTNKDGKLDETEITNAKVIDMWEYYEDGTRSGTDSEVTSTKGLELLPELTTIKFYTSVSAFDISSNRKIEVFDIDGDNISTVTLSDVAPVTFFRLYSNEIKSLDLSKCTLLKELSIQCKNLEYLDFSNSNDIVSMSLDDLSSVDIKYPDLSKVELLGLTGFMVSSFDSSKYPSLRSVYFTQYKYDMDFDFSNCPNLEIIYTYAVKLTGINVTQNTKLESIYITSNALTSLDLSNNVNLKTMSITQGTLKSINVYDCKSLEYINLEGNRLSSIDVSNLENLEELILVDNVLSNIKTGNHPNLTDVRVGYNDSLTAFDTSRMPGLKYLSCTDTSIKNLDLTNNTMLETLSCSETALSALDLSNNSKLSWLRCSDLPELNISNNPLIRQAYLEGEIMDWGEDSNGYITYRYDKEPAGGYYELNIKNIGKIITEDSTSIQPDPNGVENFCERLYTVALGRASDPQGKAAWAEALKNGSADGAKVASGFIFSKEFEAKELSNTDFVKVLYKTFMDREADPAGLNAWVEALDKGATRQQVFNGFINSVEWANICHKYGIKSGGSASPTIRLTPSEMILAFTERLYTTCLGRPADPSGLKAWAEALANREGSGAKVAHGFFFSDEFKAQDLNNKDFVTRLYKTFMDREPDPAGLQAWVKALNDGASREKVFDGFTMSPEFGALCEKAGIQPY